MMGHTQGGVKAQCTAQQHFHSFTAEYRDLPCLGSDRRAIIFLSEEAEKPRTARSTRWVNDPQTRSHP